MQYLKKFSLNNTNKIFLKVLEKKCFIDYDKQCKIQYKGVNYEISSRN